MKKIYFLLLVCSNLVWAQEKTKKPFSYIPEFYFGFITHNFQGDNYLAKGHNNLSIGGFIKGNLLHYHNFKLGAVIERNTLRVTDDAIGGTIKRSNVNSFGGVVSYAYEVKPKLFLVPEISFSKVDLKQWDDDYSTNYGKQDGNKLTLGLNAKYRLYRGIGFFAGVSYSTYRFQVNTSPEFQNYFDHSRSLSFSAGLTVN